MSQVHLRLLLALRESRSAYFGKHNAISFSRAQSITRSVATRGQAATCDIWSEVTLPPSCPMTGPRFSVRTSESGPALSGQLTVFETAAQQRDSQATPTSSVPPALVSPHAAGGNLRISLQFPGSALQALLDTESANTPLIHFPRPALPGHVAGVLVRAIQL